MKVYKHNLYADRILLAYPTHTPGCYYGIPYYYSAYSKVWERSGVGGGLPYYYENQLKNLECLGDTDTNWEYHTNDRRLSSIDASYLKEIKND